MKLKAVKMVVAGLRRLAEPVQAEQVESLPLGNPQPLEKLVAQQ